MGIGEGLITGLLGGAAGGAGQILQRNQQMDKEDETVRLEELRARIADDRAKALIDYKVNKEREVADAERSRVAGILGGENAQTKMLREQGGDDMMPDNFTPAGKGIDEQIIAARNAGDLDLADKLQGHKVKQVQIDYYGAKGEALKQNAETRSLLGSIRASGGAGGNALAQQKWDHKLTKEQEADRTKAIESAFMKLSPEMLDAMPKDADGKPRLDSVTSLKMQAIYSKGGVTDPASIAEIMKWPMGKQIEGNYEYTGYVNKETGQFIKVDARPVKGKQTSTQQPDEKKSNQEQKPSKLPPDAEERNPDAAAGKWAENVMPRFNVAQSDGGLGSGAASFFKNLGIAVDVNDKDSVFNAINEIDSYIPRLKGKQLEQAVAIRKQLMSIK